MFKNLFFQLTENYNVTNGTLILEKQDIHVYNQMKLDKYRF